MLKQKSKKWLSRLGAGMLLGLSIFSLGSSFGRNDASLPKGVGNFRRKEETDVHPELKNVVKTVQEEAELAISEQQNVSQNLQNEQMDFSQTALRFGVVTLWAASLGVIFSSLIFNVPFSLGRAALSVLPGTVHTATLKMTADKTEIFSGDTFKLNLALESEQAVSSAKVFLKYPREVFFLDDFDSDFSPKINFNQEGMELIFENLEKKEFFFENPLAVFSFSVGDGFSGQPQAEKIELVWDKSLVLDVKETGKGENILGKTVNPKIVFSFGQEKKVICHASEKEPVGEDFWQEWTVGSPASVDSDKWNDLGGQWSLGCVVGAGKVGLLLSGGQAVDKVALQLSDGKKEDWSVSGNWKTGDTQFNIIELDKLQWEGIKTSFKLIISGQSGDFSWPEKGVGRFLK